MQFVIFRILVIAIVLSFGVLSPKARAFDSNLTDSEYKKENYKSIPPFDSTDKEVDRLLFGITKEINPRFDRYGNEIRRHMARAGSVDVMVQATARKHEYDNVKAAAQILKNWKTHKGGEIIAIEERIATYPQEEQDRLNAKLSDNLKVVADFYNLMDKWIKANLDLLVFLEMSQDEFDPINPEKGFKNEDTQDMFNHLLQKRNHARDMIRAYPPFSDVRY